MIDRLYWELEERGIGFKPHVWLSSEWFSPDGVPGIAVPFYLAHPRLTRLEARQMLEVEGGTEASCMRILRHEAGHAHRHGLPAALQEELARDLRPLLRALSRLLPPEAEQPELTSCTSMPGTPRPTRRRISPRPSPSGSSPDPTGASATADWPTALRKLEYVDELMREISGERPMVRSRVKIEPLAQLKQTLRQYYEKKRERYGVHWSDFYDRDLRRLFSDEPRYRSRPTAASFLRSIRKELRAIVSEWTGAHTYTVDQVLQDMIDRCRELKLRLATSVREARSHAVVLLTVHTMHRVHVGKHEIPI